MRAMETSYQKLFSIIVQHEYFGGNPCPDLVVAPMAETARLMRDYQMRLRPETGGAAVYISARNLSPEGLPETPLVFLLTVKDPRVYQYTAWEQAESPGAGVAAFDNLRVFQEQIQEDAMLLAKPGPLVQTPVGDDDAGTSIALDRPAAGVFGVVTVHLGQAESPVVPTAMKVLAGGKPQQPRFIVPLQARQARWRYLVAGADDQARIEASVVATGTAIAFAAPETAQIAGRQAQVFQSAAAMAVLADPRGVYTAKLVLADGEERLLPMPSVASLKAAADGKAMIAEMIVMAERVV